MSSYTSRTSTPTLKSSSSSMVPPTSSQTLAKLTSISTKTLSLLLERQRSSTLSTSSSLSTLAASKGLHLEQIQSNLVALKAGILELEAGAGTSQAQTEAVKLLRKQYERMRGMLLASGVNSDDVPSLDVVEAKKAKPNPLSLPMNESNASLAPLVGTPPLSTTPPDYNGPFTPYTDDPASSSPQPPSPTTLIQTQQQLISTQDTHLMALSDSISRHHSLSLQINDELQEHHGLLEELDTELDRTEGRLGRARRRLDRIGRGLKGNVSTVMIGVLILVLLVLIIAFKT